MPRSGKAKTALRERIRKLLQAGETLVSIGLKLDKAPSTIAYHVRALGVPPIKHFRALPLQGGKRRCSACRRMKPADLFPSGANAMCTRCYVKSRNTQS